jgi:hypothetical protein
MLVQTPGYLTVERIRHIFSMDLHIDNYVSDSREKYTHSQGGIWARFVPSSGGLRVPDWISTRLCVKALRVTQPSSRSRFLL